MRQALEKMNYHKYTAIPVIDDDGKYLGTLTEEDLLWKMRSTLGLTFINTQKILLKEIERRTHNSPVSVNAQMEDLITRTDEQYFIPVIDDFGTFIGIILRSELNKYCANCSTYPPILTRQPKLITLTPLRV